MQYNLEAMLRLIKKRTGLNNDDAYLVDEINSAYDWTFSRIMTMNEDISRQDDETFTMTAVTSDFDLGAAVSRPDMYAIKWLGVKFLGNSKFSPVRFMDSAVDVFMSADQDAQPAMSHPVLCDTKNFSQVRFAPPLPVGAQILVSYVYIPQLFDLAQNAAISSSSYPGIPNPVIQSITDKATAQVFSTLDDTRMAYWEEQHRMKLRSALNVIDKRQWQQIPKITGFKRRAARRLF